MQQNEVMNIKIEEMKWEIVDGTAWTKDWVGLSSGDIYMDGTPFGHYVAAWYPNTARPLQMIIATLDQDLHSSLSIGVQCARYDPESLAPVSPSEIPWESDGVLFGPVASPEEFVIYSRAREALAVAADIIRLDRSLHKYIVQPDYPIIPPNDESEGWN